MHIHKDLGTNNLWVNRPIYIFLHVKHLSKPSLSISPVQETSRHVCLTTCPRDCPWFPPLSLSSLRLGAAGKWYGDVSSTLLFPLSVRLFLFSFCVPWCFGVRFPAWLLGNEGGDSFLVRQALSTRCPGAMVYKTTRWLQEFATGVQSDDLEHVPLVRAVHRWAKKGWELNVLPCFAMLLFYYPSFFLLFFILSLIFLFSSLVSI